MNPDKGLGAEMASFLGEIKRRKVFQVAAVYMVVAWLVMQVVDVVNEPLRLPEWFATVAILLLAIGFPIALLISWAFDLTPHGLVREESGQLPHGGRRIEYVLIGLLVVAVGWLLYRDISPISESAVISTSSEIDDSEAMIAADVLQNSIAVLPLENLSPDPENQYFAEGMHEEILNQLAKLRNMRVISRTSVMQYRENRPPIPAIAEQLRVETVLEGSVRFDGQENVLVQVQLIDAATDYHLWSESYERNLAEIFAIQADIAMHVANAIGAEFSPAEQARLEQPATENMDAYTAYIRAQTSWSSGGEYINWQPLLDEAIDLDPRFARAYAMKAFGLAFNLQATPENEQIILDNANRALQLDPDLGVAHAALGFLHHASWRGRAAEEAFARAYELSPNDSYVLTGYGRFKRHRGEYEESVQLQRRVVELNPNESAGYFGLCASEKYAENLSRAANACLNAIDLDPANGNAYVQLAEVEALRGNPASALRRLQIAERLYADNFPPNRVSQIARTYAKIDRPDDVTRMIELLTGLEQQGLTRDAHWAMAYYALGDYDRAYERVQMAVRSRDPNMVILAALRANTFKDPELGSPRFTDALDSIWERE